jgi:hypothetical protein
MTRQGWLREKSECESGVDVSTPTPRHVAAKEKEKEGRRKKEERLRTSHLLGLEGNVLLVEVADGLLLGLLVVDRVRAGCVAWLVSCFSRVHGRCFERGRVRVGG